MAQSSQKIQHLKSLRDKKPALAYLLNIPMPGLGNCYYGRPVMGVLLMIVVALAVLLFFAGAIAGPIGWLIVIVSIIGALFTFGLSLILLPIGLLMIMLGAGPLLSIIMYVFSLAVSELLVATKRSQVDALSQLEQHQDQKGLTGQLDLIETIDRVRAVYGPPSARLPNTLLIAGSLAMTGLVAAQLVASDDTQSAIVAWMRSILAGG